MEASDKNPVVAIDYERLISLYGDNPRMIRNTFGLFLNEVLPDFEKLELKICQQQWPEAATTIHQLLPWLGMVGLTQLEAEFRSLERMAQDNVQPEPVQVFWNQFKSGFDRGVLLVREELARMNS